MRIQLHHLLWTHAPAMLLWLGMLGVFWQAPSMPAAISIHFGVDGSPNRWVSLWEYLVVAPLLIIGFSALLDEIWARDERSKSFNWLSLLDETFMALLAATAFEQLRLVGSAEPVFHFPWRSFGLLAATAVALAAVLDLVRPHHPSEARITHDDTTQLEQEIAKRQRLGQRWAYWEIQGQRCMTWIVGVAVVALVSAAFFKIATSPFTPSTTGEVTVILVTAAFVGLVGGGLRIMVTPAHLLVRMGVVRIPLLRVALASISRADVHRFSPLKDFGRLGGFWIRLHGDSWGFFLRGNAGVKVTTRKGTKYLIGSDHPERLAAVLRAATRLHPINGTVSDRERIVST